MTTDTRGRARDARAEGSDAQRPFPAHTQQVSKRPKPSGAAVGPGIVASALEQAVTW